MSVVVRERRRWHQFVYQGVEWDHPLARGLNAAFVAQRGIGPMLDITRLARPIAAASNWVKTARGFGTWSDSTLITQANSTDLNYTGAFTVAAYFTIDATLPNGDFFYPFHRSNYVSGSNNQGWALTGRPPDGPPADGKWALFCMRNDSLSNAVLPSTTGIAAGTWLLLGTSDGTTRTLWLNGVLENTTTTNPSPLSNTATGLELGQSFGTFTPGAGVHAAFAWNRVFNAAEIGQLYGMCLSQQLDFLALEPSLWPVGLVSAEVNTPKAASDTVLLSLGDLSISRLASTRADPIVLNLVDMQASMLRSMRTDVTPIMISDVSASVIQSTRTDSTLLALTEVQISTLRSLRPDGLNLLLSDLSSVLAQQTRTESLLLLLADLASIQVSGVTPKSASDSLLLALAELSSLNVPWHRTESLLVSLADVQTSVLRSLQPDTLTLTLADTLTSSLLRSTRIDTLLLQVMDSPQLLVRLQPVADSLGLTLAELVALTWGLQASDVLLLQVAETELLDITFPDEPVGLLRFIDQQFRMARWREHALRTGQWRDKEFS